MEPASNCGRCPRLAALRRRTQRQFPDYHNAPVTGLGDPGAPLLIVGLAPGLHGAHRTGRPFHGDASGHFLFAHLAARGWQDPAGRLRGVWITNAVKCLPPGNRPSGHEVNRCNPFLGHELRCDGLKVVLALGRIAHDAVLKAFEQPLVRWPFGHRARHVLPEGPVLIDSYHCSRYNTQTGRLTEAGFASVLDQVERELG